MYKAINPAVRQMFSPLEQAILKDNDISADLFGQQQAEKTEMPAVRQDLLDEKAKVMTILSKWKVNASLAKKREAEQDCDRIIKFINAVCSW